ncbi:HAD family hydrolase [Methanothermococcus sp. Ax23]|uniref:HAD family hydrolase n=1 Tax=Methanothermococcus sp. Ax23 TaxID=3156486 RepID=UPI003BA0555A
MKIALVFDCSGTLVRVKRIIKDVDSQKFLCDNQTVDIVDEKKGRALIIIKENINLMGPNPEMPIVDLLSKTEWGISYCNPPIIKENILKDRKTKLKELQDPTNILNRFEIGTDYGYALIVDTINGKIEYTIATGGCVFPEVPETIKKLKEMKIKVFVASGDGKYAVEKLSELIGINKKYIMPEAHQNLKKELIINLKKEGYKVIMVGDASNDVPAMLESDLSVITLQNGNVSKKALDVSDIKIENIKEIIGVVEELRKTEQ